MKILTFKFIGDQAPPAGWEHLAVVVGERDGIAVFANATILETAKAKAEAHIQKQLDAVEARKRGLAKAQEKRHG